MSRNGSSPHAVGSRAGLSPGATSWHPAACRWRIPGRAGSRFENHKAGGAHGTSPAGAYPANGYGLVDTIGNVWEWTSDWYRARRPHDAGKSCCTPRNPRGGSEIESRDPRDPSPIPRKVIKGGSYLCAPNYCQRYRPAARHPQAVDSSTSHIGFRCVRRTIG